MITSLPIKFWFGKILKIIAAFLVFMFSQTALAKDCVILLHGVLRDAGSMRMIENDLIKHGYFVVNDGYPSTSDTIENLSEIYIPKAIAKCPKNTSINFVTHSMGGIMVRAYYKAHPQQKPNRVVMIAPPNQGSEVIDDELFKWFGGISGKSGAELGTDNMSLPNQLGAVDYPVGIIAGDASINPLFSDVIKGIDDGAVGVDRTHVEGESDWVLLKFTHSFAMYNVTVRKQALAFLQNGRFAD